ncbi:MAG: hypothetical protein R3D33_05055 [Hyphomicrobiaceae bacterium]
MHHLNEASRTRRALRIRHLLKVAPAVVAGFALMGCADGVELNGKIFDAMGVSGSALSKRKADPVVAERTGLVVPPTSDLPEPGTGAAPSAVATADPQWPSDPEKQMAAMKAREEADRKEKCSSGAYKRQAAAEGDLKDSGCGSIWTMLFNSGIEQPDTLVEETGSPASLPAGTSTGAASTPQ